CARGGIAATGPDYW
nr:immunoglobulin heavy chain junction region [Macaca mulatta]MOW76110.1 immunoglobulin heavy chain junction region [Macaca mulatta]MOW76181.1 immunoglobulin heavy chain junction region [Macaca mulatta]MOW76190.1 immunoglobulin heavy chain junction region [Macaca mulatta]MOW79155.1 immunoglobulin heavy chain junction region [Macaca mulatta]